MYLRKPVIDFESSEQLSLSSSSEDEDDRRPSSNLFRYQLRERKIVRRFFKISYHLIMVDLKNCGVTDGDVLSACTHLRMACLAENLIEEVPKCLPSLRNLQILDLSSNKIATPNDLKMLTQAPKSLIYLNLRGNPVSRLPKYRAFVTSTVETLSGLDAHVVADEERIPDSCFSPPYCACHKSLIIPKPIITFTMAPNDSLVNRLITAKCKALYSFRLSRSPVVRVQRAIRAWITRRKLLPKLWSIMRVQALYRGRLFRRKLAAELQAVMKEVRLLMISDRVKNGAASIVQYYWRKHVRDKVRWKAVSSIQKWYRKAHRIRAKAVRWIVENGVKGIIIPVHYKEVVVEALKRWNFGESVIPSLTNIYNVRLHPYTRMSRRKAFCFLRWSGKRKMSSVLHVNGSSSRKSSYVGPPPEKEKRTRYVPYHGRWMAVATPAQLRSMRVLASRGRSVSKLLLADATFLIESDVDKFRESALRLMTFRCNDATFLYKVSEWRGLRYMCVVCKCEVYVSWWRNYEIFLILLSL